MGRDDEVTEGGVVGGYKKFTVVIDHAGKPPKDTGLQGRQGDALTADLATLFKEHCVRIGVDENTCIATILLTGV